MDADRRLRIAFLLPTFPELSNTFILTQITGLLDRGHDVDLFAIQSKSFEMAQPDVARYDLQSRMRHVTVPRNGVQRAASAVRIFRAHFRRPAALLDALNPMRHGRAAWNLVQLHTAASFLRSRPYDIVHCQFGNHGPSAERLIASGATSGRLVTSFRGADMTTHLARYPRRFHDLLRHGSMFLPVSRDFRERLVALGVPADRVHVQHSGIDIRRFAFSPRREPEGRVQLLFVGRLTEKKGLVYALEALASLGDRGAGSELTVVGDGPLLASLKRRSADLGLSDRVRFVGSRPHAQVIALMRASHLLLAPSVTAANGDQEGIPNVLKEAMATGLPVLTTRHTGIPELVEHGASGLLAPERDADTLAMYLKTLLEHPELWPNMGRIGRQAVEHGFDANRLNDVLVRRYRATLTKRRAERSNPRTEECP